MKKPVLVIGILLFVIFILDLKRRGKFFKRTEFLKSTSCHAVLTMLDKRIPNSWKTKCEGNNLAVTVDFGLDYKKYKDSKGLKTALYRDLANHLIFISKNSANDSLERVGFVRIKLRSKLMDIDALTEGKYISKLATISDSGFIAEHIGSTVKVKETTK